MSASTSTFSSPLAVASAPPRRRPRRFVPHLVLVLISLMILVPVLWVVLAAVKTKGEFYGNPWALPEGLHLQNFVDAFVAANMGPYLLNSLIVTTVGLTFALVIAVPAAYGLARFEFRGKSVLETLLLAGLFINVNYIVIPIFLMLLGWDKALRSMLPSGFFINNLFVLALVYAATSLPFTIYLLLASFRTIPVSYEEAATLDGSSRFRTMTTVMLPMAMPAISTAILFNFLSYWNDYIISLTLIPGDAKTLQVGLLNLFQAQKAAADYGRLYAGMVIVIVPVVIVYIIVQKRLLQGVAGGGLKE